MKIIAGVVFYVMDGLCERTGHDVFLCWNAGGVRRGPRLWAHRLYIWAYERA